MKPNEQNTIITKLIPRASQQVSAPVSGRAVSIRAAAIRLAVPMAFIILLLPAERAEILTFLLFSAMTFFLLSAAMLLDAGVHAHGKAKILPIR